MESSESRSISAPPPDGRSSFTATATPTTADALYRVRSLNGRTVGPARRSTKGQWTAEEDEILRRAVQRFKGKNWKKIAECFKDRTDVQCLHRWQKVLNPELVKGPWSKEEDEIIIELVNKYGPKKWSTIAQHLPGRIGKQCRERWHNHLNPAINKEAWTQEEELILIRAHQLYGNKWAELTKFLPGRTDNAIKNHWNSSVKKKLDSYLASGLLEQFQGLPLVVHQTQALPSTSSKMQNSADDSGPKCGMEAEEISECSQESIGIGCTEAANDLGNAVLRTGEETPFPEDSSLAKEHCSSPPSCAEPYYASPEDARFSIPEMPCEAGCSSDFFHRNFSHNPVTSASRDYQLNMQCMPHMAALQSEQYSGLPTHCTAANQCHELVTGPFQALTSYNTNTGMGNFIASSAKLNHILISDEECCRFFFSEAMNGAIFSSANLAKDSDVVDLGGSTNSLIYQSSNIQISEIDRTDTSGANCPSASDAPEPSCSQSFPSGPVLLSAEDCIAMQCREPNQLTGHSSGTHEEEIIARVLDGFIYADDSADSPCDDGTDLAEQPYKESAKLVPVNSFTSGSENMQSCSASEKPNVETEQQEAGALCYEPPRFPGLDIPFLSCDLVQSGSDMHQDYSPLGIRQLMSSMNCISPFRLWESPSRDNSPDGLLKSAAKTFTGTPSILKKRNRDLLSPLSDRKVDKKLEIDVTSSLAKEFSRLEVMFDDCETQRISLPSPLPNQKKNLGSPSDEDKENFDPALGGGQEKGSDLYTISHSKTSEKNINSGNFKDNTKQGIDDAKIKVHPAANAQILEQPPQVIVEDNMNDLLLFSPDQLGFKGDKAFGPSARTPRNLYRRILGTLSEQALAAESSSGSPCLAVSSPTICRKNHESQLVAATSAPPSGNMVENIGADAGGNISIFGETPFKRSIESPSAWKSPWFINSFLPGPRIDSEFSIEDIGYLLSPGDRSLDALALMKQLSEHTASAFADALEVLGNETPETLLSEGRSRDQNMDQGKNDAPSNQPDNHSNLSSSILTERRVLDFSECGTPGKGKEKGKSPASISLSSPSAYLLKGCR